MVAQRNGAPATGLSKDDFRLLDNGKKQTHRFLLCPLSKDRGPTDRSTRLQAYSQTGLRAGRTRRRLRSSCFDQMNTPQTLQAYAIARIGKFVDSRPGGDRIGIYTLLGNGSLACGGRTHEQLRVAEPGRQQSQRARPTPAGFRYGGNDSTRVRGVCRNRYCRPRTGRHGRAGADRPPSGKCTRPKKRGLDNHRVSGLRSGTRYRFPSRNGESRSCAQRRQGGALCRGCTGPDRSSGWIDRHFQRRNAGSAAVTATHRHDDATGRTGEPARPGYGANAFRVDRRPDVLQQIQRPRRVDSNCRGRWRPHLYSGFLSARERAGRNLA